MLEYKTQDKSTKEKQKQQFKNQQNISLGKMYKWSESTFSRHFPKEGT